MRSGKKKPEENSIEALEEEEGEEGEGEGEGEEEEEEEEENPEGGKTGGEREEPPKLEEGFYEIEAIRRRRVRKGQLQYLIKWRGWPESANTWEPIDNLRSCSDVIEAYEERLQKSSRKKKRRVGPPYSALAKSLQEPDSSNGASREVGVKNPEDGDKTGVEGAEGTSKGANDDEAKREGGDGGSISIQINGGSKEEGLVEDGSLKGAKKRKSGSVKRFKPEGAGQDDKGEKMGNEDADSGEDDNGEKQRLDEAAKAPYIVKILKAVEFDASVTNNVQQVSLKFKALRSDGQEVIVDDKDLKLNNPLVLINFYEQHLRYSPPTCDVNEQQS